jgi:hypothetical protein
LGRENVAYQLTFTNLIVDKDTLIIFVFMIDGSILGMLMILAGLYLFLWGKMKEYVPANEANPKNELQIQSEGEKKRVRVQCMI